MAMAAFERARDCRTPIRATLRGIGGDGKSRHDAAEARSASVHVAWQSAQATVSYSCELVKGKRTRAEEEAVAAELVLHAVAEACGDSKRSAREPSAEEP